MDVQVTNQNRQGTVTFTTTSVYVDVLTIEDVRMGVKANIANLSSDKTMYWKATAYMSKSASSVATVLQSETSLAAATTLEIPTSTVATRINENWGKVVFSVKQNSGAGAGQIDFICMD